MARFDPSCIDVFDYLDCLEVRNVEKATENEVRFSCPYPAHSKGDETPSAYMNVETTAFFCHSCKKRGNAISLAAQILRVSPVVATRMLRQRYSPGGIDPDARNMREEISKILHKTGIVRRTNDPLSEVVLDSYRVDWEVAQHQHEAAWAKYIFGRGFSTETLRDWEFGYSNRHQRITLPIRDEKGRLVGIKARATDEKRKPKYLNLRDDDNGVQPYLKNDVVFALNRAIDFFERSRIPVRTLIVVEGEYNAIAMHELGYVNTVAINGSYFGERQIRLLKQYADRLVLFFDSDDAGFAATQAVADELLPFLYVDVCPDHYGDPMVMHPYTIRRCLAEARGYMGVRLARS